MLDFRWSAESSPLSLICSFSTFGSVSRFLLVWVDHSAPCLVGYHPPKRRSLRKTETYLPVGRDVSSSEDESFSLHPPLASALGPWSISLLPLVGGEVGRDGQLFVFYTHRSPYSPFSSPRVAFGTRVRAGSALNLIRSIAAAPLPKPPGLWEWPVGPRHPPRPARRVRIKPPATC